MQPCHFVRGINNERVLIPGCWSALMDGREACLCIRDKTTFECLEERVERLEQAWLTEHRGTKAMSKKPKIGGTVQISGKPYMVLSAPLRLGEWFSILVLHKETDPMCRAVSEAWRGGCGPWKLIESNGDRK